MRIRDRQSPGTNLNPELLSVKQMWCSFGGRDGCVLMIAMLSETALTAEIIEEGFAVSERL
jgi:hypothetical protein